MNTLSIIMMILQYNLNIKIVNRVSKLLVLHISKRFYPHNIKQLGLVPSLPRSTALIPYVAPNTALILHPKFARNMCLDTIRVPFPHKSYFNTEIILNHEEGWVIIRGIKINITHLYQPSVFQKLLIRYRQSMSNNVSDQPAIESLDSTTKPKIEITLINKNGNPYITTMSPDSTVNDFTKEEILNELQNRGLIKDDDGATAVNIKTDFGDNVLVGKSINDVKLSPLGQAYVESTLKSTKILYSDNVPPSDNIQFMIVTPPQSAENTIISTGIQKHLLIVYDKDQDKFYSIGYLTSKISTDEPLCPKQFKTFQNEKDGIINNKVGKQQYFAPFENKKEIDKKDVHIAKNSQEYFESINQKHLNKVYNQIVEQPYEKFNNHGLILEDCIKICQEHDRIVQDKKLKHPLTEDQIKKNLINSQKQKEENDKKNAVKHNNPINDENDTKTP